MNKRKIFVGNLSYTVTENQLAGFLSKHGEVLSVKVMEGKGYAFVEMKTPEQAQAIKNSLSEEMFEGRRLLLDDVPSKGHNRRKTSDSSFEGQSPRNTSGAGKDTRNPLYRSGAPVRRVRTEENAHQLTDVTDEFKKKYNKEQKPVNQDKQQKSHPASPKSSVRSSPPPAAVRGEGKSVPKQQERDKPITQVERAEQSPRKYTKTAQTGRGPEKSKHYHCRKE
jgi:RNA recognition motif-containing protein